MKTTSLLRCHVYIECSQLVQYFTHSFTTCQLLNVIASYEYQKNECVQQWNLFKCQTSTFYFSTYCLNLFEHLLIHAGQTVWETRLLRSLDQSLKQHIGQVFFKLLNLLNTIHYWYCSAFAEPVCQTTLTSTVIRNLSPQHWHQFRITAVNIYGSQAPSEPSSPFSLLFGLSIFLHSTLIVTSAI